MVRRLATAILLVLAVAAPSASAATSLGDFQLTYYWFAAESGFVGKKIAAPGIAGTYREDFLYSSRGVPMEGTGTVAGGAHVHYAGTHGGYWVTKAGVKTVPGANGWSNGAPYWREGGWRTAAGAVTFQRADGSWVNGTGTDAAAVPRPLRPRRGHRRHRVAVDRDRSQGDPARDERLRAAARGVAGARLLPRG